MLSASPDAPYIPARHLTEQVTGEFVQAGKAELQRCRLSTQKALIDSAMESRSTLKAQLDRVRYDGAEMREKLAVADRELLAMKRSVHEERYQANTLPREMFAALCHDREVAGLPPLAANELAPLDLSVVAALASASAAADLSGVQSLPRSAADSRRQSRVSIGGPIDSRRQSRPSIGGGGDSAAAMSPAEGRAANCYTPRARLPFELQTKFGISLVGRSRAIVEEVCAVALQKHQDVSDLQFRLRSYTAATEWMDAEMFGAIASEDDSSVFLPTLPESEWATAQHFLRTTVQPHVPNERWTGPQTARRVLDFFCRYDALRDAATGWHDAKMFAPKACALWERRRVLVGCPIDATVAEMHGAVEGQAAPAANDISMSMGESYEAMTIKGGTVPVGYVVSAFIRAGGCRANRALVDDDQPMTKAEVATAGVNLWHYAKKYRLTEPLCDLFLLVLDGQLPVDAFRAGEEKLARLYDRLSHADTVHMGNIPYRAVSSVVLAAFAVAEGAVWRAALHNVVATLRDSHVALTDRIPIATLMATELQGGGATRLTKFVRRHVHGMYLRYIQLVEEAVAPAVTESAGLPALSIVRITSIAEAMQRLDGSVDRAAAGLPDCTFVSFGNAVVAALPRLNASAHLPAAAEDEPASGASSPRTTKKRRQVKAKLRVQSLLQVSNDQSLVEWFAFRAGARALLPTPDLAGLSPSVTPAAPALGRHATMPPAVQLAPASLSASAVPASMNASMNALSMAD
jgi:hypothetical protein